MPVSEIDRRLSDRFELLQRKGAGQTLGAVLEWSFEGLPDGAKRLLVSLVQVPGSWTYDLIDALGEQRSHESVEELVNLALVTFDGARYRCLNTVREFARRNGPASNDMVRRTAQFYFREVAERFCAPGHSSTQEQVEWFVQEEQNLVWVLHRCKQSGEADLLQQALVMYSHLYRFWLRPAHVETGFRIGKVLLEGEFEPTEELAAGLLTAGGLAHRLLSLDEADRLFLIADSMTEKLGLRSWRAELLLQRADLLSNQARLVESEMLLRQSLAEFELLGNVDKQAMCLRNLGYVLRERGEYSESIDVTQCALHDYTQSGDAVGRYWCIGSLGATYLQAGNPEQAAVHFLENIGSAHTVDEPYMGIWNRLMLAEAEVQLGKFESAETYVRAAIELHGRDPDEQQLEWPVSLLGEILTELEQFELADQALDRAWRIHATVGTTKLGAYTMVRKAELYRRWGKSISAKAFFDSAEQLVTSLEVHHLTTRLNHLKSKLQ